MSADATLWSSEAWASAPDASLLARTRDGSAEAFGELWRRHLPAAYAVANRHRGRSAPEDVVAEAASRVLALIREGRGPDENFRAYFLSAVRTVAIDQGRRELRLVPTEDDDLEDLAPAVDDPLAGLATDEEGLALVRTAFAELPERDQRILWHTTVEGAAPRAVAPGLGMTANAVSVRAMRAREQLRANYLDARAARELAGADSEECRWTVSHLGAFVRGRLPKRQTERARAHVAGCPHAAALAADLRVIHDGFPALVVPLVVAAGLATPGFVTGGAVAGLSAVGTVTGTSVAAAGPVGAGPAGAADVGDPSAASAASSASTPSASAPSASSQAAARAVDAVAQVAGRATGLAAALAVTAGVAGVLGAPGPSLADSRLPGAQASSSAAAASSPAGPVPTPARPGPGAVAGPSAVPTASGAGAVRAVTGTPFPAGAQERTPGSTPASGASRAPAVAGGPRPTSASAPAGSSGGGGATPARPQPSVSTPTGTPTAPDAVVDPPRPSDQAPSNPPPPNPPPSNPPPSTPPLSTPPVSGPEPAAPAIAVRLVKAGDTARISVRVRTEAAAGLTVSIGNRSGAGRLTVRNSSWECAQVSRATVSCSGGRGSAVLDQSGTRGVVPLVVRVTDRTGRTWSDTVNPT